MLRSSADAPTFTALAGLAVLTLLIVPVSGALIFFVGKGVGHFVGQIDPTCNAVLDPRCLTATSRFFFGMAEIGLLILFSPALSWLGMVLMTPVAALLSRFTLGGPLTFVASGAVIGACVAKMMLTDWDIAELGGLRTFALMGAGYAFVFWCLVQYLALRRD